MQKVVSETLEGLRQKKELSDAAVVRRNDKSSTKFSPAELLINSWHRGGTEAQNETLQWAINTLDPIQYMEEDKAIDALTNVFADLTEKTESLAEDVADIMANFPGKDGISAYMGGATTSAHATRQYLTGLVAGMLFDLDDSFVYDMDDDEEEE